VVVPAVVDEGAGSIGDSGGVVEMVLDMGEASAQENSRDKKSDAAISRTAGFAPVSREIGAGKTKTRNPKHETRNNVQSPNGENPKQSLPHRGNRIVLDFLLRSLGFPTLSGRSVFLSLPGRRELPGSPVV
jgi:hypothetical protein